MNHPARCCQTCRQPLPPDAHPTRRYCDRCRGSVRHGEREHRIADCRLAWPSEVRCSCGATIDARNPDDAATAYTKHREANEPRRRYGASADRAGGGGALETFPRCLAQ